MLSYYGLSKNKTWFHLVGQKKMRVSQKKWNAAGVGGAEIWGDDGWPSVCHPGAERDK